jgi:hypothetical protein
MKRMASRTVSHLVMAAPEREVRQLFGILEAIHALNRSVLGIDQVFAATLKPPFGG